MVPKRPRSPNDHEPPDENCWCEECNNYVAEQLPRPRKSANSVSPDDAVTLTTLLSTCKPQAATLVRCPNQTVLEPGKLKQLKIECRSCAAKRWDVLLSLSDEDLERELCTFGAHKLSDKGVLTCLDRLAQGEQEQLVLENDVEGSPAEGLPCHEISSRVCTETLKSRAVQCFKLTEQEQPVLDDGQDKLEPYPTLIKSAATSCDPVAYSTKCDSITSVPAKIRPHADNIDDAAAAIKASMDNDQGSPAERLPSSHYLPSMSPVKEKCLANHEPSVKRPRVSEPTAKPRVTCAVPDGGEYYVLPSKAALDWNYTRPADDLLLTSFVPGTCGTATHDGLFRNVFFPDCNAREFAQRVGVKQSQHFSYMLRGIGRKTAEGWCGGLLHNTEDKHQPDSESPGLLALLGAASSDTNMTNVSKKRPAPEFAPDLSSPLTNAPDQPAAKKVRMVAIYNTEDKRQPELQSSTELKQGRTEEVATAAKLVHVDKNQLPPLVIKEECPRLLTILPEIQLLILQQCDPMALSRIDQVCKALSTPRPPLSLLQRAVQNKLRSEYPSTSLNVESWPAHLAKIEQAHRAGSSWENPTAEVMC